VCVFITAGPITKLFARGGGGEVEDMCYERLRAEVYVKILFRNGNLTLALAGWWRRLWAGSGCGGSGRAPGWCGWAVSSLLRRCCGGAGGRRRGRPPDGDSCSRRAGLHQCKLFVEMCIVSCLSAVPACVCGQVSSTWEHPMTERRLWTQTKFLKSITAALPGAYAFLSVSS